ncbi:MAG TPA: exosortase system-associated protein, TIGR04073 family [Candidatus Sumerlaeota bacterium]|nr:exosortase system-associated protein, TIGR04073 family [Candidatus Sumerlaeota bacterium]HPS01572.1 exosortase system-associated protein, TIGR04073 family [Candidatus Sumerlaeota bacterium]
MQLVKCGFLSLALIALFSMGVSAQEKGAAVPGVAPAGMAVEAGGTSAPLDLSAPSLDAPAIGAPDKEAVPADQDGAKDGAAKEDEKSPLFKRVRNDKYPDVKGYEVGESYVYIPPVSKGAVKYMPPIEDVRRSMPVKEVLPRLVQPMPEETKRKVERDTKVTRKFARGFANTLFGWLEVPRQMNTEIRESNMFTGFLVGGFRGCAFTVTRTGVGLVELVTFWQPIPNNYAPIMEPEFVWDESWGEPLAVICDPHNNFDRDPGKVW